jgi:SAP domain
VEGTGVPIQQHVKKAKMLTFKKNDGTRLSPILDHGDKENSDNDKENSPNPEAERRVQVKPPPSSIKRRVQQLRVVDLKKELKSKCLPVKGLKNDLQQRLLEAYSTVEKAMSPPKQQQINNKTSNKAVDDRVEQKKDQTPAAKVDDGFPDSDSVEVVVFEPSSDAQQERRADGGNKMISVKSVLTTGSTKSSYKAGKQNTMEYEAMDIEPASNRERNALRDNSKSSKGEIASTRDCTITSATKGPKDMLPATRSGPTKDARNAEVAKQNDLVAKPELSTDNVSDPVAPLSVDLPPPLDTQNPNGITQLSLTASMPGQQQITKMSLESMEGDSFLPRVDGSLRESQTETQAIDNDATKSPGKSDTSDLLVKPSKHEMPKVVPPRAQSPITRGIQATIQMLTAKSATKPKPTTTPGKLQVSWMKSKNPPQQCAQMSEGKAPVQLPHDQQPVLQPISHQKQNSAKRDVANVVGKPSVLNSVSNISASASTAAAEARKARIAAMREKVSWMFHYGCERITCSSNCPTVSDGGRQRKKCRSLYPQQNHMCLAQCRQKRRKRYDRLMKSTRESYLWLKCARRLRENLSWLRLGLNQLMNQTWEWTVVRRLPLGPK